MVTTRHIYDKWRDQPQGKVYLVAETHENVLLCNKEIRP